LPRRIDSSSRFESNAAARGISNLRRIAKKNDLPARFGVKRRRNGVFCGAEREAMAKVICSDCHIGRFESADLLERSAFSVCPIGELLPSLKYIYMRLRDLMA
jgi:hypothetical protein